jgi:serine/threonine protein kinase
MVLFILCTEAADLIHHLLMTDPAKRATTDNIYQHWWFKQGLTGETEPVGQTVDIHALAASLPPTPAPVQQKPLKGILKHSTSSSPEAGEERALFIRQMEKTKEPKKGILKNKGPQLSLSPVDMFCRGELSCDSGEDWMHDPYNMDDIEKALDDLQSIDESGFVPESVFMIQDTSSQSLPQNVNEAFTSKAPLKGILKHKDRTWSVNSQGSTSSGDVLDFSYDSN